MPVEIKIYHDDASAALAELTVLAKGLIPPVQAVIPATEKSVEAPTIDAAPAPATEAAPKRRGRPPKAAEPIATVPEEAVPEILAAIEERKAAEDPKPAISATPEDRVNPDDEMGEEDDGIEEMQEPGAPLTVDDLRNAAGRVVRACGNNTAAAQAMCAGIFKEHGVESISKCPDDKLPLMVKLINDLADAQEKK